VLCARLPRLLGELPFAKGDGRIAGEMKTLVRVDLLILDDWGLKPPDGNARHHLLEILEERYGRRSTLVASQLPEAGWHELIKDPTHADAVLDRLIRNAHRVELSAVSLRQTATQRPVRPRTRTSATNPTNLQAPGRDHLVMMAGFKSE
jgi:DNA replication protein DnaC